MTSGSLIGKPVRRLEDERFLRGQGDFTDDYSVQDALHAVFIRSAHAHARIKSVDGQRAVRMPGVKIFADCDALKAEGMTPIDPLTRSEAFPVRNRGDQLLPDVRRWPLACGKVRFVGEPVAVVAASSASAAMDGAEAVVIEYEPLPPAVDFEDAISTDAPLIWEELGSNVCVDLQNGDACQVNEAIRKAATVVSMNVDFPRHAVAYLEPKGALARYDAGLGKFEVRCGSQSPQWHRAGIAEMIGVPIDAVQVISPDTGGGFGARTFPYPEYAVTALLARITGRPVKWTAERSECFATDTQSRDQSMTITLAVDDDQRMTAVRLSSRWRLGAYLHPRSVWLHASYMYLMMCGVYRIKAAHYELRGVFSNTAPIAAFRGVARAETSYALERVVERAAGKLKIDPLEFRRKNLISQSQMPWTTPTGANYCDADFHGNVNALAEKMSLSGFAQRCKTSAENGKKRAVGYSVFIDSVGGTPNEFAEIEVVDGIVEARVGTKSTGMGHETVFAQLLASRFQIDLARIRIVDDDTDKVRQGSGSHASRSLQIGGSALFQGADRLLEEARRFASLHFEVAFEDVEYRSGSFRVPGTDREISLFDLARTVSRSGDSMIASAEYFVSGRVYASGAHACEVEVDIETGEVFIVRFWAVSDPGLVFNPLVATGQVHGGIAHGIGHAILEGAHYDRESGQLLTGSFLDYAIPRADDLLSFETVFNPIRTRSNPTGVKGVGETGVIGAPAAVINAIENAVSQDGPVDIQMPAVPERIWRAVNRFTLIRK